MTVVKPIRTLACALGDGARRLTAAGIDTPRLDARLLLAHAVGVEHADLIRCRDDRLAEETEEAYGALIARRAMGEPVARIVGEREFWSLPFVLGPETLDPRPDSETLIEAALAAFPDRGRVSRILDLGTGSGCLLLAALTEFPKARGTGLDIAAGALETAKINAERLDLTARASFIAGGWDAAPAGPFDLILANPPYIPSGRIAGLPREVRLHDPRTALDGGADGLAAYRALAPAFGARLSPQGVAIVEIGENQAEAVERIIMAAGLTPVGRRADLAGRDRAILFTSSS